MKTRLATACCVLSAITILVGCGGDDPEIPATSTSASSITYRLTPASDPNNFTDGSFLGYKFPPWGSTGIPVVPSLSGTFEVVSLTPASADVVLDYRIVRIDMVPVGPAARGFNEISGQGEELGRIQLYADGTLSMRLRVRIIAGGFDMEFDLAPYNLAPYQYRFENGRLLFRGVALRTPFEEPYFGSPGIFLWADPES